jgi:hypothetical protein
VFGVGAVQEINIPLLTIKLLTSISSKTIEPYNVAEGKHFIGNKSETIFSQPIG